MVDSLTLNEILSSSKLSANDILYLVDEEIIHTEDENGWQFAPDTLIQVRYIDSLTAIGYTLKDAVRIIKSFGTPDDHVRKYSRDKGRKQQSLFTPGELAKLFNVSPRAVKYWEEKQLIRPYSRSKSGIRFYHKKSKIEIMLLKAFQSLGFSLERIKVFLDLYNYILEEDAAKKDGAKKMDSNRLRYFLNNLDSLDAKLVEYETSIEALKKLSGKGRQKIKLYQKRQDSAGDPK